MSPPSHVSFVLVWPSDHRRLVCGCDHLGIFAKPGLMLYTPRNDYDVAPAADPLFAPRFREFVRSTAHSCRESAVCGGQRCSATSSSIRSLSALRVAHGAQGGRISAARNSALGSFGVPVLPVFLTLRPLESPGSCWGARSKAVADFMSLAARATRCRRRSDSKPQTSKPCTCPRAG
jgi:hypothetical protein